MQHDLTRHIFLSGSLLQVWQGHRFTLDPFADRFSPAQVSPYASRFSDFGAGWRFTSNLFGQYIYSTDYGVSSATHSLMLRYTFGKGK